MIRPGWLRDRGFWHRCDVEVTRKFLRCSFTSSGSADCVPTRERVLALRNSQSGVGGKCIIKNLNAGDEGPGEGQTRYSGIWMIKYHMGSTDWGRGCRGRKRTLS